MPDSSRPTLAASFSLEPYLLVAVWAKEFRLCLPYLLFHRLRQVLQLPAIQRYLLRVQQVLRLQQVLQQVLRLCLQL
jgi:hypothetical protein